MYRIHCSDTRSHQYHAASVFKDIPFQASADDELLLRKGHGWRHLNGTRPVHDLCRYMEENAEGIAVIICRSVSCINSFRIESLVREGGWQETIYITSNILMSAIQSVARCYFTEVGAQALNNRIPSPPYPFLYRSALIPDASGSDQYSEVDTKALNKRELSPPDLFLYHHRSALKEYAKLHPESMLHIDALLEYGEEIHGRDFTQADELFRDGMVTTKHLCKLFLPNELVVSSNLSLPSAFMLQEWPVVDATGAVCLKCWCWRPDGRGS